MEAALEGCGLVLVGGGEPTALLEKAISLIAVSIT
jgi:hypothetical protein